ncbi:xanthine dehydrogenase family protein molybdopterin-binding subunit [Alphaproteobacteria bacterium]|nr:xanthine dehydrogenase family protein molybdopterin-binding subunit [Alphaproteobacteria bacterium]
MVRYAVGQAVPRTEDPRLLKGVGRYVDDIRLANMAHGYILRSPVAHALIKSINTSAAEAASGILAVLTGADFEAAGLNGIVTDVAGAKRSNGTPIFRPPRPALVTDKVRVVGDYVAFVVAETLDQARDAAELIEVDYEPLPVMVGTAAAAEPDAVPVWDECPDNISFEHNVGDAVATEAAFSKADVVVKQRFVINRVSTNSMENRGCIGEFDKHEERYVLHTGLQQPHNIRADLAKNIFNEPEYLFRIVSDDVGGSFGMKGGTYPEYVLVLWSAKVLGRPVKWYAPRSESFISDTHSRDNVSDAELALSKDGKFLGVRCKTLANLGAYVASRGPNPPMGNVGTMAGTYTTEAMHVNVRAVLTNTHSTAPYRGAGRPEAAYVMERLIDIAAYEMELDPAELRRINLIPKDALPYQTALTFNYDSGDFEKSLDMALELADYVNFEARRKEAAKRGKMRGIGISNTIEQAGGRRRFEHAEIRFTKAGSVLLLMGTISHGQGHDTTFKQILSDRLGVPAERIRMIEGDTDQVSMGEGTGGSRSAELGGAAIYLCSDKIVEKGKKIAAHNLEAAETDIEFSDGTFTVAGTDKSIDIMEVAQASYLPNKIPADVEIGLDEMYSYLPDTETFPNGTHVCELEVDPDTGAIDILKYSVIDDVGVVVNPLLLKGQIHGGVGQGLGQALLENIHYDEDGQILTGSFMDYCMPRADDICAIEVGSNPQPCTTNPTGIKGAGEAGTVGALPCVANAVVNALSPLGTRHIEMPATPEVVWRAIETAKSAAE